MDVLMNNAGVMMVPKGETEDGYELHFGTNVLGGNRPNILFLHVLAIGDFLFKVTSC